MKRLSPSHIDREQEYEWLIATRSYNKILTSIPWQDPSKTGEIYERLGYAFYRAARQSQTAAQFQERMQVATVNYEKATESYERLTDGPAKSRVLRCQAMIAFARYWLEHEPREKKRLVDEAWRLTKAALEGFEQAREALEYSRTFIGLSGCNGFVLLFEWDRQTREKLLRDAIEHGEKAIKVLSDKSPHELTRAYVRTAYCVSVLAEDFLENEERDGAMEKIRAYWTNARTLSEGVALLELVDYPYGFLSEGIEDALAIYRKALDYAKKTGDRLAIGGALQDLAYYSSWKTFGTEDPDKRSVLYETALECAREAKRHFSPLSFISPNANALWPEVPEPQYYWAMSFWETDLKKKRELLEKAKEAGPQLLKRAEESSYAQLLGDANHVFSRTLASLARTETRTDERRRLLETALVHRAESVRIVNQIRPLMFWDRGLFENELAEIEVGIADLVKEPETRTKKLVEACSRKEAAWRLCSDHAQYMRERTGEVHLFPRLGVFQYENGRLLNQLYDLTGDKQNLVKAASIFREAAESFRICGVNGRIAECHWKAAESLDRTGEYSRAAENFDAAAEYYDIAGKNIHQLKELYGEFASYMRAWSEIEKARYHHARQEYGLAKQNYERAASLHKSAGRWGFLATNYLAWAHVEHAEDLSRKESSEEALRAFMEASGLFDESKTLLQVEMGKIEVPEEKKMVTNLVQAADLRREYCQARMKLEEAKLLDRKDEHLLSAERYGEATKTFEKIAEKLESEQARHEFILIIVISRAWQSMAVAEAEGSPELYLEASKLFEEAGSSAPMRRRRCWL